jgi:hypothetical protein
MSEENILSEDASTEESQATTGEVSTQVEQPSSPVSSNFAEFIGADGKISESYMDKYLEYDTSADRKSIENFLKNNGNDLNRVMKSSLNLNKMLGKEKIPLPGEDADAATWDKFFEHLGAPGEDGDYKFDDGDIEGLKPEIIDGMKSFLKEAKVPQRLADRIVPKLGQMLSQTSQKQIEDQTVQIQEAIEGLQADWGRRGSDEWKQNLAAAQRGAKIFAADNKIDNVKGIFSKYGNDPFLLKVFADKGRSSREGGTPPGGEGDFGQSFSSIDERIAEANRVYQKSGNQADLEKVMSLRDRKERLSKPAL